MGSLEPLRSWFVGAPRWLRVLLVAVWVVILVGLVGRLVEGDWQFYAFVGPPAFLIGLLIGFAFNRLRRGRSTRP